MHSKPLPWHNDVFIDHPRRAKAQVRGIVVGVEREGMSGLQPPVVRLAALRGRSGPDHDTAPLVDESRLPLPARETEIAGAHEEPKKSKDWNCRDRGSSDK